MAKTSLVKLDGIRVSGGVRYVCSLEMANNAALASTNGSHSCSTHLGGKWGLGGRWVEGQWSMSA